MENQIIAKEDEPVITLRNIGRRRFKVPLKPKDLTDIRNPDLVIEIVNLLALKPNATEEDFSKSTTPFNRTLGLARSWGLIDGRVVTNKGRALLDLDSKHGRYGLLAILFEKSNVGMSLREWGDISSLSMLQSSRAHQFMIDRFPRMPENTRKQRGSVLASLIRNLLPHHPDNRKSVDGDSLELEEVGSYEGEPFYETNTIDLIDRIKPGTQTLRISTGFMTAQGYELVARNLKNVEMKILLGKDDERGTALLADPLQYFRKSVSYGIQSPHKQGAHRRLLKELLDGSARVRKAEAKIADDLHGKGYFFDYRAALPSSANLTKKGLQTNIETGLSTGVVDECEYFVSKFEGYYDEAEDITTEMIEDIIDSWIFQPPVDPYLSYLRGLIETFGSLATEDIGDKYELASFQQMIVASIIRSLRDLRRALVISPTGSGKTVMGSYTIAATKDIFEKAVVIVLNEDMREKWENDCLSFGLTPRITTHQRLQKEYEEFCTSDEGKKLHMLLDEKTLIVIDEIHKFRTDGTLGNTVLENILNGTFNGKKPGVLMLTATPIGTGFENLQVLYDLMGLDSIPEKKEELVDLPGFVNVTLPFIMDRFSEMGKDGNPFLRFGKKKMYYAKRRQQMSMFDDGNGGIYNLIRNLDFKEFREEVSLDSFGIGIEPASVDNMVFSRLLLAQAVYSSQEAALESIDQSIGSIEQRRYLDPEKTRSQLIELREYIQKNRCDIKYSFALEILKNINKKSIVFVGRKKTREMLADRLSSDLGKKVEEYKGTKTEKQKIRERFAPKANKVSVPKKNQIDILIATSSASEGHDLQDGELVLDYDLWWTPLQLQQRMGRLDRPTEKPREFSVRRLVNTCSEYSELVKIDEKLDERSKELKGIIADGAYEKEDYRDWKITEDTDLGLVTREVENCDESIEVVTTSRHIVDLAYATEADRKLAIELPTGFQSSMFGNEMGTFALLKHGKDTYMGFQNEDEITSYSPGDETYEKLLGLIRSEKGDSSAKIPDNHLESVELVIGGICELHELDKREIETVFSVAVKHDTTD
jgi:superfamily II DNA or RNA helicase